MFVEQNILARFLLNTIVKERYEFSCALLTLLEYMQCRQQYRPYFYRHTKCPIFVSDFNQI